MPLGQLHVHYRSITGVLALGSSIAIQGGNYDYTDIFLQIPSGITVRDSLIDFH